MDSLTKETRSTRRNIIQRQMNNVQKQLLRFTTAALIVMVAWSCKPGTINDTFITASVSAGTSAGLKLAIKDVTKQKVIAQYLNNYAGALRTITGDPTDDQLTQQLISFIPADIQSEYPELQSFAVPMIVSLYHWAKEKYGANSADFRKVLADVASGIELGSAPFAH